MPLILRVDVDKPYGRSNIINKVKSKLVEDYWFPKSDFLNYLYHVEEFIEYCNSQNVVGYFYFRNCTIPNEKVKKLLIEGNHKIGFHAEDTRNFNSFNSELNEFKKNSNLTIDSFTKHGSGNYKLGKNHYPPYEPDVYLDWANSIKLDLFFGNGICRNLKDLLPINGFYPYMFWIERDYRDNNFNKLSQIIDYSIDNVIPILIHPCNFNASKIVKDDFKLLIEMARDNNIKWTNITKTY